MAAGQFSLVATSNLAQHDFPNEEAVLAVLKRRFEEGCIYVSISVTFHMIYFRK